MSANTDLGAETEDVVATLVGTGRYGSRQDVLREGVKLLEQRESMRDKLDAALARGLADADAGRVTPLEEVGDRLTAKYRKRADATAD